MISDTLHDAGAEIAEYVKDLPEVYEPFASEIADVLKCMDALRTMLDTPPKGLLQ